MIYRILIPLFLALSMFLAGCDSFLDPKHHHISGDFLDAFDKAVSSFSSSFSSPMCSGPEGQQTCIE